MALQIKKRQIVMVKVDKHLTLINPKIQLTVMLKVKEKHNLFLQVEKQLKKVINLKRSTLLVKVQEQLTLT